MKRKTLPPTVVCCIIERPEGSVGIATRQTSQVNRLWEFPRDLRQPSESHEAAVRRTAAQILGLQVEVEQGQPPLPGVYNGSPSQFRYFLCSIEGGDVKFREPYVEFRWVLRAQLCEYDFVEPDGQVVKWYSE